MVAQPLIIDQPHISGPLGTSRSRTFDLTLTGRHIAGIRTNRTVWRGVASSTVRYFGWDCCTDR